MDLVLLLWTLALWGLMAVSAILNGSFRQFLLIPWIGRRAGHVVSCITLSAIILLISYLFFQNTTMRYSVGDLWLVGLIWMALAVAFEFGLGHFVLKRSWSVLLEDYNILKGRIWVVVLIVTLVGPYLTGR